MGFNIRQQNVIDSDAKNILCLSVSASGKTATLVGRIMRLLDEGVNPSSIVCFTFTNQAGEEMKKRIGEKGTDMFIGTIHSYANKICGIAGVETADYIVEEKFDEIIEEALKIDWTFYPSVDYLFVDEFQDTDPLQFRFINKIPAKNRYFTGDERQFIYQFRGATDKFIRDMFSDDNIKKYFLVENYRNPPNIIRFADSYLDTMPKLSPSTIPIKTKNGHLEECNFVDVAEELTWTKDWTGWTILCRTNNELLYVQDYLDKMEIPNVIIKRGDLNLERMNEILKQNKVKIMTIHASKGLEFPNVIAIGCRSFNLDERRISYVAATRAKEALYWCPTVGGGGRKKPEGKKHFAGDVFSKSSKKMIQF